jgi:hypothetical protein
MTTALLPWLVGLFGALALAAFGFAFADVGWATLRRGRAWRLTAAGRRRMQAQTALRAYRPGAATEERIVLPPAMYATWAVLRRPAPWLLGPVAGGVGIGLAARDLWFTPFLIGLGLAVTCYLAYRQTLQARQGVGDQVRRLVEVFVGLYRVSPTTFTTLERSLEHLKPGPVRDAVSETVRHYSATRDPHTALTRLYAVGDPYLTRFAMILDQAGEQGATEILRLLEDMSQRLRRRWTTRLAAQGVFASIRGTLAVLVGVALTTTAVGVTMALWRDIHARTAGSRLVFMALTTVAFLAAAFFDRRMRLDEETLL